MRSFLVLLCLFGLAFRADKPAYRLYTGNLKPTTYAKLLRQANEADVILFGELHNNPICHWLQLQLTKDVAAQKKEKLVLGAEMFEADNQQALSQYVTGKTTSKELADQARLWTNFKTDYKPLVEIAREQRLPFVATNVPRRYASLVAKKGLIALDTISTEAKQQMAPLPLTVDLTLPGYKAMLDMMAEHGGSTNKPTSTTSTTPAAPSESVANFARAQAIKDATMAHFILQNLKPGQTFLHFNGDYHSKNFEGIVWYLRQQRPNLRIMTISSVEVPDPNQLEKNAENRNRATVVLAIPADMTKTY